MAISGENMTNVTPSTNTQEEEIIEPKQASESLPSASYNSVYTGAQVDSAVAAVLRAKANGEGNPNLATEGYVNTRITNSIEAIEASVEPTEVTQEAGATGPSVEADVVWEYGERIGPNFSFKFHNILGPTGPQGLKGDTGAIGPKGDSGGPTGPAGRGIRAVALLGHSVDPSDVPEMSGTVMSVNGKTGVVILSYADVGAPSQEEFNALRDFVNEAHYKAPTIRLLSLQYTGSNDDVDLTSSDTSELERIVKVTGFKHQETQINEFSGNLSFKYRNTVVSTDIMPSDSEKSEIVATETLTFSSTTATTKSETFTLSGVSKKGELISRNATISVNFYFPRFYGASGTVPDASMIKTQFTRKKTAFGTVTVEVSSVGYIWFCTTSTISEITSGGFEVPFEQDGTCEIGTGSYKLYRTGDKITAGNHTFVVTGG